MPGRRRWRKRKSKGFALFFRSRAPSVWVRAEGTGPQAAAKKVDSPFRGARRRVDRRNTLGIRWLQDSESRARDQGDPEDRVMAPWVRNLTGESVTRSGATGAAVHSAPRSNWLLIRGRMERKARHVPTWSRDGLAPPGRRDRVPRPWSRREGFWLGDLTSVTGVARRKIVSAVDRSLSPGRLRGRAELGRDRGAPPAYRSRHER